jgi:hypothetical protein
VAAQRRAVGRIRAQPRGTESSPLGIPPLCYGALRVDDSKPDSPMDQCPESGEWKQTDIRNGNHTARQARFVCHFCDGRIIWNGMHYAPGYRTGSREWMGKWTEKDRDIGLYSRFAIRNHLLPLEGEEFSRIRCPYCWKESHAVDANVEQNTRVGFPDADALLTHIEECHSGSGCCIIL